jgi:hypothetical protein
LGGSQLTEISQVFYEHICEVRTRSGITVPLTIAEYLALLCERRLRDLEVLAEPSFSQVFLKIVQHPHRDSLQSFGDQTLLALALMPQWTQRRGLQSPHFRMMAVTAYDMAWNLGASDTVAVISRYFETVETFFSQCFGRDCPNPLDKYFH